MTEMRDDFDLIVVGGGATGVGVLLDASSRGLRTALIEADDVGSGTSSASSKLIHGGLRYLENGEVRLVAESLAERAILSRTASHLVRPLSFVIPVHSHSRVAGLAKLVALSAVLYGYDAAGSLRSSSMHRTLSKADTLERLPSLKTDGLVGSNLYHDAFADDARLCLSVALTATEHFGATILTHTKVVGLTPPSSSGWVEIALESDPSAPTIQPSSLKAKMVVLAGGVSNGALSQLADTHGGIDIVPSKGVHLVVRSEDLPLGSAGAIDVGDGRRIFVVPWGNYSYFGTTDTPYAGNLASPDIDRTDVDYLLSAVNRTFSAGLTHSHITGGWSGLRPLIRPREDQDGTTTELSRRYEVTNPASWAVVVSGGKLTTYRRMAEVAVDIVCDRLGQSRTSITDRVNLVGSIPKGGLGSLLTQVERALTSNSSTKVEKDTVVRLVQRYGSRAVEVAEHLTDQPDGLDKTPTGDLIGEFRYQILKERATTVSDLVLRRSRIGILDFDLAESTAELAKAVLLEHSDASSEQLNSQMLSYQKTISSLTRWRA